MTKHAPRREGANSGKPKGSKKSTSSKPPKLSPGGRPLKGKPKPKLMSGTSYGSKSDPSSSHRPFNNDRGPREDRGPRQDRPFNDRPFNDRGPREERGPRKDRPFNDRPFNNDRGPREDRGPRQDRPFNDRGPREDRGPRQDRGSRQDRPYSNDRPFNERGPREDREPRQDRGSRQDRPYSNDRPFNDRGPRDSEGYENRNSAYTKPQSAYKGGRPIAGNPGKRWHAPTVKTAETHGRTDGEMRLNRYLAMAGICSRRDADRLIADGMVLVNGAVVLEMGYKVLPTDEIRYAGEVLKSEKKVYLVLNKPKGFITSMDDEKARKTVMELISGACRERIYPVGRLDRATTGVLLFTNDGDLAKKLTHPSHGAKKIYSVSLDRPLSKAHFAELAQGIHLDDGPIHADEISQIDGQDAREIGIALHSGRNRIVRRMFEHLGYEVMKLDRVQFGPITKKNLARGQYRFLNEKEVSFLKMI